RRRNAVVGSRKASAGQQTVNQRKHASPGDEALRVRPHLAREGDEDAMDFRLFLFDEAHQLVVLLDGFKRLDVNRLSRRTGAVNHAGDAALELAAHRNDEALAADGDQFVLRGSFAGELAQSGAQALLDDPLLAFLL